MASISTEKSTGRKSIQFAGPTGKRQILRLGKVTKRQADFVRVRVERILSARAIGVPLDQDTAKWVGCLDSVMRQKLAALGLVGVLACQQLGPFLEAYRKSRSDVKPSTQLTWQRATKHLLAYFDPETDLRYINSDKAESFRRYLKEKGLADNTIRRTTGLCKQFFAVALKQELIQENPFIGLASAVTANPSRYHFITREDASRVLEACPDDEWRLIFALSRFGGLRCPSEHMALRWEDIDWEKGRFTVHSSKTEHHIGGAERDVPIFPELAPLFALTQDQAQSGAEFVITRYRASNTNLRTQLTRILTRAGLKPWPKLFQNLRSSCETDLVERFPLHVVTKWLGNSVSVAQKHYLQTTEEHFRVAIGDAKSDARSAQSDAFSDAALSRKKLR